MWWICSDLFLPKTRPQVTARSRVSRHICGQAGSGPNSGSASARSGSSATSSESRPTQISRCFWSSTHHRSYLAMPASETYNSDPRSGVDWGSIFFGYICSTVRSLTAAKIAAHRGCSASHAASGWCLSLGCSFRFCCSGLGPASPAVAWLPT